MADILVLISILTLFIFSLIKYRRELNLSKINEKKEKADSFDDVLENQKFQEVPTTFQNILSDDEIVKSYEKFLERERLKKYREPYSDVFNFLVDTPTRQIRRKREEDYPITASQIFYPEEASGERGRRQ